MSRENWIVAYALVLACALAATAQDADLEDWNAASGVNLSLEEGYGARHSGMAITFAGFQADANAAANAPAAMNDVDDFTFSTAHAEKFGEAKFDDVALLIPLDIRSTLGLGLSRFGVSGIDLRPEGVSAIEPQPAGQFSIADYLVVASFARRWRGLDDGVIDVGAAFNLLYRQLDQDGFGLRADAMAQYTWEGRLRLGALVKGFIPSSATWESGYREYESPDLHLGIGFRHPAPYFYGTLQAAYQTEGLFQKRAKSQGAAYGSRAFSSPAEAFQAGNLGLEFLFDFGLALRVGLAEAGLGGGILSSTAIGVGYAWKRVLGIDYSFAPHPDLAASHRIALQFTPAFPKFNGRNFRTGGREPARAPRPEEPAKRAPTHEEDEDIGEEIHESPETVAPPAPAPAPSRIAPAPATAPAPIPAPAQVAPAAPTPPPMPAESAPKAPAEQLETEEEIEEGE